MGRLGVYFPKFCNIVNRKGSRVETINDLTDRIVFVSSGSLIGISCRLLCFSAGILLQKFIPNFWLKGQNDPNFEISPKVGFSVANFFLYPIFQFFFVKSPK